MPAKRYAKKKVFAKLKRKFKSKFVKHNAIPRRMNDAWKMNHATPFKDHMYTMFNYTGLAQVSSTASTDTVGSTLSWRLNSIYDPYLPGSGNPNVAVNGFTQYLSSTGPYLRYKVRAVKIRVMFNDPDRDSSVYGVCAFNNPSDTSTISGLGANAIMARQNTMAKYVTATGSQKTVFNFYFPMHKLFQVTKLQYETDIGNTTGAYNGSPASAVYIELGCLDSKANASSSTVALKIDITYYVELYDRYIVTS